MKDGRMTTTLIFPSSMYRAVVDYGKQKNVGVILWSTWYAITRDADGLFAKFSKMGVKGFKIDFIDRDDQKAVSSLHSLALSSADHHFAG